MKYLRKFNEGLTQKELKEVRYDLEDVLIEIDDLNIKRKDDFLYKIDTYSNSSSMRDVSISETFRIDVRFWKNGGFFRREDFEQLKPVFDTLVRTMEPHSKDVDLVISHWDIDENECFNSLSYDKMIDFLQKIEREDDRMDQQWFYTIKSKITGFKLKFNLDK
jgi:hypothetical protein